MGERGVYRAYPVPKKRLLTLTTKENREIDMPGQKISKFFGEAPEPQAMQKSAAS